MGRHFIRAEPRTPADDVRKILDEAEVMLASLRSAGSDTIEILRMLDSASDALEELETLGVDVRPERGRFEAVQRRLSREKRRFVRQVGGALEKERASTQPDRERQWWYLDEALVEERRRRLRRLLTWGAVALVLLVVVGVVYYAFLAPPPQVRLSYRRRLAGENLAIEGDLEEALDEFEAAAALVPDDPEVLLWVGVLRSELDKPGAESAFEDARRIYETPAGFLLERARVYRVIGNLEAALADVEEAIVKDPGLGWNYFERAAIYQGMGNRDAAIDDLETADALAEEAGDHELRAVARYQLGLILMAPPGASTPTP